ncbi:MAG: SAM-dependent methyltransferase [Pseudomonadota bacterium]|nr:SAM-dependent methyltransferase [Pseudomonadota bacterium]
MSKRAPLDAFLVAVQRAIADRSLVSVVLSKRRGAGDAPTNVRIRLIELRGAPALSFVHSQATRDVTKNHDLESGVAAMAALLDAAAVPSYAHATLHRSDGGCQLMVSRGGRHTLRQIAAAETRPAPPAPSSHDLSKRRMLPLDLPFLIGLGITDERHRLIPSMARKWKQIDKFLEVLDGALDNAAPRAATVPLRIVDFGSGKGYLTFAVHEHLRRRFGIAPQVTGIELRADLVDLCNRVAESAQCGGLRFVQGDLRSFEPKAVDVMIALHACDIATDHALDLGLRAGASVLVCSPCCHKELRPQMASPAPLGALFRHGIHLGQEAEMVTDSLRALLLESAGYEAKVFEFVSLEHTNKNKMILATRREQRVEGGSARALAQVGELKTFYGIREQRLERLLQGHARTPVTSRE